MHTLWCFYMLWWFPCIHVLFIAFLTPRDSCTHKQTHVLLFCYHPKCYPQAYHQLYKLHVATYTNNVNKRDPEVCSFCFQHIILVVNTYILLGICCWLNMLSYIVYALFMHSLMFQKVRLISNARVGLFILVVCRYASWMWLIDIIIPDICISLGRVVSLPYLLYTFNNISCITTRYIAN